MQYMAAQTERTRKVVEESWKTIVALGARIYAYIVVKTAEQSRKEPQKSIIMNLGSIADIECWARQKYVAERDLSDTRKWGKKHGRKSVSRSRACAALM